MLDSPMPLASTSEDAFIAFGNKVSYTLTDTLTMDQKQQPMATITCRAKYVLAILYQWLQAPLPTHST